MFNLHSKVIQLENAVIIEEMSAGFPSSSGITIHTHRLATTWHC